MNGTGNMHIYFTMLEEARHF